MTTALTFASGLPLHVAGSDDSSRAIIVIQEAFGVNEHILSVVDFFASQGFYAVAPELFHRDGSPVISYDDFPAAMGALGNLTRDGITADLMDSAAFLTEKGFEPSQIAIVGYCMGGTVATFAGTLGIVAAAASFYGGGVLNGRFGLDPVADMVRGLTVPWIGLYGEMDKGIPAEHIDALRVAISESSIAERGELNYYPDADHGFNCNDRTAVYNEAVAQQATAATVAFFERYVSTR